MKIEEFKEEVRNADAERLDLLIKSYKAVWCPVTESSFMEFMNKYGTPILGVSHAEYLQRFKDNVLQWVDLETSFIGKDVREALEMEPLTEIEVIEVGI